MIEILLFRFGFKSCFEGGKEDFNKIIFGNFLIALNALVA